MQAVKRGHPIIRVSEPNWDPRVVYTNQEILNALARNVQKDYRLVLSGEYFKRNLFPNAELVINRFGSWREAMRTLGLDVNHPGLRSRNKAVRLMTAQLLVHQRFGTCDPPDYTLLRKVKYPSPSSKSYTDEELLELVTRHIQNDHRLLFATEYQKNILEPSLYVLVYRFGTWKKTMEKIGFNMNHPGLRSKKREKRFQAAYEVARAFFDRHLSQDLS